MKDLLVIYRDTSSATPTLKRGFNLSATKVVGREWMVQKIAKHFLTEVGSNFYDPLYGVFLGNLSGSTFSSEALDYFKQSIAQAVHKIEKSIIGQQILDAGLTEPEILSSISVESIKYDKVESMIEIYLQVTMVNNDTFRMRV
jgi:hypothetical protein